MKEVADFDALSRKANELNAAGTPLLALTALQDSFSLHKDQPAFWVLVGTTFDHLGQPQQSAECYRRALELDPGNLRALVSLGLCLHSTKDQAESQAAVKRALSIDPDCEEALILSVSGTLVTADLSDRRVLVERIRHFVSLKPKLVNLIKAGYFAPFLDLDYEMERQIWAAIREAIGPQPRAMDWKPPSRGSERSKLRIGYVSPYFGDHPIGHVTKSLYRTHDRNRFDVYIYSVYPRPGDQSEYKAHIRESCDKYIDISGMDVRTAQAQIVADQVDILVDLNGYMVITKIIEIFAGKPAPVQVYWLGHAGALGLPFYDYVIGDATVTPPEDDHLYVESIARLPHTFHPTDRHEIEYDGWTRRDCGLDEDAFVFCAFCAPTKIDPEVFRAWAQILKRVPGSQLWLARGKNPEVATNLRRAAEAHGLGRDRLVFAEHIPDKRRHLGRHRLADLFLDTFTVNASTMALDALWAGLPILTRPGRHFCARNCTSFLKVVGLDDMVCSTTQEYVERAVHFGTNPDALKAVRSRLWENRESRPFFDIEEFTRNLENAYQIMWERFRSGKPPASFSCAEE